LIDVLVECLPKDLPEYIEVDISGMQVGDSIHLSELAVPAGVTLVELARGEGHDTAVVSIHAKRGAEEAEAPPAEGESGEASS
jgi:large subunit ribosomal protein L25